MSHSARRPFTQEDKDNLAEFLAGIPKDKRTTPATHKEMERRHPGHTYQAWMHHYRQVDNEGINRRIEAIRRARDRAQRARRDSKGKARAAVENGADGDHGEEADQLATDEDGEGARASKSSKMVAAPGTASSATTKRKKALKLPSPSSSSPSLSSDDDAPSASRRQARKKYTPQDYKQLVKILYRAEQEGWLKHRIYEELEKYDPDHSALSWQTYHSNNRDDVEQSLHDYKKLKRKAAKRRLREDTAGSSAAAPSKKKKKKAEPVVELSDHDELPQPSNKSVTDFFKPAASGSKSGAEAKKAVPAPGTESRATPSTSAAVIPARNQPAPAPSQAIAAPRASLPPIPTAPTAAKAPRPSLAAFPPATVEPAAKGKGKGKERARETPAIDTEGPLEETQLPVPAGPAPTDEPFTPEEEGALIHQLARAELKGWEKDSVFAYLEKKFPHRTAEAWTAYYRAHIPDLLPKVGQKAGAVLEAQRRKREAEALLAAERTEAERRAREAEEQREREEWARMEAEEEARREAEVARAERERVEREVAVRLEQEAKARAEQARVEQEEAAMVEAERVAAERVEAERVEAERVEAAKVEAARVEAARVEEERAKKQAEAMPTPAPAPPSAKLTSAPPAGSTVLTPRSTPPARAVAPAVQASPVGQATLRAMYGSGEVDEEPAPFATGSSLPRLSQYSVAPSPFLGAAEEADELASDADSDDRVLDAKLAGAVADDKAVKVESLEPALEVAGAEAVAEDSASWYAFDADEFKLIIDTHELIEELSARVHGQEADLDSAQVEQPAEAPQLGEHVQSWLESQRTTPADSVLVETPRAANVAQRAPSTTPSKKRRRQDSTGPVADKPTSQQPPALKRQRVVGPSHSPEVALAPVGVPAAAVQAAAPKAMSSSPAVARRVPRASLAAVEAGSSPAPAAASATSAAPAPPAASASSSRSRTGSAAHARVPLKDELAAIGAAYGHSFAAVRDLYFCVSALSDMSIVRDAAAFYSRSRCPEEGTAELERVRRRIDKYVWSLREDTVVLEGTDEARARVDERKGRGAVAKRREFLRLARMTKVADLRASIYPRKL